VGDVNEYGSSKKLSLEFEKRKSVQYEYYQEFFFDGIKKIYNVHKNTTSLQFLDDGKYVSRYRMFG
jgi:hypothetical protein